MGGGEKQKQSHSVPEQEPFPRNQVSLLQLLLFQ